MRRIGKFKISHDLIEKNWREMLQLMSTVFVLKAESNYADRVIEYVAFCPAFREIPEGEDPPSYTAHFERIEDYTSITWKLNEH